MLSERYAQRDKRRGALHPGHRSRKPHQHILVSGPHDPVFLAWLVLVVASRGRTLGCDMETAGLAWNLYPQQGQQGLAVDTRGLLSP
jgi:hypothetical protein